MKANNKIQKIVLCAVFAALSCVTTVIVQVPSALGGYVNLGDCSVILGGWLLGGPYGFLAGAIGSALADVATAYFYYAPGTFVIKGLVALVAYYVYKELKPNPVGKYKFFCRIISAICAEVVMIIGYFFYSSLILGDTFSAALTSIPGNVVQGVFGIVSSVILIEIIMSNKFLAGFFTKLNGGSKQNG